MFVAYNNRGGKVQEATESTTEEVGFPNFAKCGIQRFLAIEMKTGNSLLVSKRC